MHLSNWVCRELWEACTGRKLDLAIVDLQMLVPRRRPLLMIVYRHASSVADRGALRISDILLPELPDEGIRGSRSGRWDEEYHKWCSSLSDRCEIGKTYLS